MKNPGILISRGFLKHIKHYLQYTQPPSCSQSLHILLTNLYPLAWLELELARTLNSPFALASN